MVVVEGDVLGLVVYVDGGDNDVGDGDAWLRDERERGDEVSRGVMMGLVVGYEAGEGIGGGRERRHLGRGTLRFEMLRVLR